MWRIPFTFDHTLASVSLFSTPCTSLYDTLTWVWSCFARSRFIFCPLCICWFTTATIFPLSLPLVIFWWLDTYRKIVSKVLRQFIIIFLISCHCLQIYRLMLLLCIAHITSYYLRKYQYRTNQLMQRMNSKLYINMSTGPWKGHSKICQWQASKLFSNPILYFHNDLYISKHVWA